MIAVLDRSLRLVPGLAFIMTLLVVIEILVDQGLINRVLLPPPSVIGRTLFDLVVSGEVQAPLLATLGLFAVGFVIAAVVGVVLGLLMGTVPQIDDLMNPLVEFIRPMPKAALVPVLILFLGLGAPMKITSISLASVFPILINTVQGVRSIDPVLIATGRTFGWSRARITTRIVLPATLPYIAAGLRISVGLALLMTVLSEMLAGTGGLGAVILENQRSFRIRQMYAWLVLLAVIGLVINWGMASAERRLAPWLEKHRR